jgi:hypothetical protein
MIYKFKPVVNWPRKPTALRQRSQFSAPYSDTLKLLDREISQLNARNPVIIQTFMSERDIRHDDLPRSDAREPNNPGVIVTFDVWTPNGKVNEQGQKFGSYKPISFPCDRFKSWKDNLRAIALALEALRKVDRYGVTQSGEQYAGWKALPAMGESSATMTVEEAARWVAGHAGQSTIFVMANKENLESAYKDAARKLHPDSASGNHDDFVRLGQALGVLRKHFK